MTFFSILFALIAEQYRPVTTSHWIRRMSSTWLDWVAKEFSGKSDQGATPVESRLACLVGFGLPSVLVLAIYLLAFVAHPLLAFVWNIIIVYLFFGFRQFSHSFTEVHEAIQNHDLPAARAALQNWLGGDADVSKLTETEIIVMALEKAIVGAHRHVFGVFFWFLVPIGPAGVVLYRLADTASVRWERFGFHLAEAAKHFFYILDWAPVRLSAMSFAIVGNFEDSVYAWRNLTSKWSDPLIAVLLASGSGALGVRLGEPLREPSSDEALAMAEAGEPPIYEIGHEPSERSMRSAIGLVWRALIVCMVVLAMLTIALWAG